MFNCIYLYGLAGARDAYKVVRYDKVNRYQNMLMAVIKEKAKEMAEEYPSIKEVYIIDNTATLHQAYRETAMHFSIEDNVAFKSLLENEAIRII